MPSKIENTIQNIEKIKLLYQSGVSVAKIAKLFGVGQTTMFRFFDKNEIGTRSRQEAYEIKNLTQEQEENVWHLYHNTGLNREEIANRLKISQYSVRKLIDNQTLPGKQKFKQNMELNTVPLTYEQKQIILGSLLGDACLSCRKRHNSDQLEFSIVHGEPQIEYIKHTANILNSNISEGIQGKNSFGCGNKIFRLSYCNKYELIKIHKITYFNGRKTITNEWLNEIDPLALAYWFMDDGSSSFSNHKKTVSITFATQSFNKIEHDMLRNKLLSFGIDTTIQKSDVGTGMYIYIRQKSVNRFMDIVEPYIKIIPCMNYKIKRKQ